MSGKDNAAKAYDSLGRNHLVVGCDVGQLTCIVLSLLHQETAVVAVSDSKITDTNDNLTFPM